jgi:hypothetical protein
MKNFDRFEGNRDKPNTSARRASKNAQDCCYFGWCSNQSDTNPVSQSKQR